MGIDGHSLKGRETRPIAAFDFDGTLTVRDSLNAFLTWRFDTRRLILGLARLAPAAASYLVHRDRGRLKGALLGEFLAGETEAEFRASADRFARERFEKLIRPDALACWEDWRRKGALRVIVTASPEPLVEPFARALGADLLLGSRLAVAPNGRVLGPLAGPNCRGPEKVVRLKAAFGEDVRLAAAYGDTNGDREMLAIAASPGYRVFKE